MLDYLTVVQHFLFHHSIIIAWLCGCVCKTCSTFFWPILFNGPASASRDCHGCYGGCYLPPLLSFNFPQFRIVINKLLLKSTHFFNHCLMNNYVTLRDEYLVVTQPLIYSWKQNIKLIDWMRIRIRIRIRKDLIAKKGFTPTRNLAWWLRCIH